MVSSGPSAAKTGRVKKYSKDIVIYERVKLEREITSDSTSYFVTKQGSFQVLNRAKSYLYSISEWELSDEMEIDTTREYFDFTNPDFIYTYDIIRRHKAKKSGLWTIYFDNGVPAMKGKYLKGKKIGEWNLKYPNGINRLMINYDSNYYQHFDTNGNIVSMYKNEYLTGSNETLITGELTNGFLMGGNMGFKTSLLNEIGGFPVNFGKGSAILFGEETYVEYILRNQNRKLFYSKEIVIYHFGNDDTVMKLLRLNLNHYLSSLLLKKIFKKPYSPTKNFFHNIKKCLINLILGPYRLIKYQNYYVENWLISNCFFGGSCSKLLLFSSGFNQIHKITL